MKKKWFCAQVGAREHYSVPRVLHQNGRLAALYTDFWAGAFVRGMARGTTAKALRSLAARFHPELADAPVTAWNVRSLAWEAGMRHHNKDRVYENFAKIGAMFASCVRDALDRRTDLDTDCVFFSYDTGALEAMELCRERGVKCVLNQMDPNRVEVELVHEEEKNWPGWSVQPIQAPEEYFRRREEEWALADSVIVNSDYCRQAIVNQGVPPQKITVVPLCFETGTANGAAGKREQSGQKSKAGLRVLFLGQVILRKGIQYLIEAAKLLQNEPVQFDVVGPVGISKAAVESMPENIILHGRATRDQTADWYRRSDVFVLPTLSDGFAITQLEAMSYGLPVVTTPCCGAVVSNGLDGFIVPPRSADALAKAIQRYLRERELLEHQHHAALAKAGQFTLGRLAENLCFLEDRMNKDAASKGISEMSNLF